MLPGPLVDPFAAALADEQTLNARRMILLRVIYACVVLMWTGWAATLSPYPSRAALAQLPLLTVYLGVSAAAFGVLRRYPRWLPFSWWLLVGLDLPLIVGSQLLALEYSTGRLARVEATLGQLFFLVAIAQLSLRPRFVFVIAAGAALGHLALLHAIEFRNLVGRWLFTPVYFGVLALVVAYLPGRLRLVLQSAVASRLQRERLSRYFSPAVAEQIQADQDVPGVPRRFDVTVLFADLRGFTRASAQYAPEEVARLAELHQTVMVEAVFRHGGTLDKFLGDGLLAYFGAPLPQADHARRAALAAQDIVRGLRELRVKDTRGELPVLAVAVGLHSGSAVVGAVGPPVRREFTILGDVVNVASRVEGVAKKLDQEILASGATRSLAGSDFDWREFPPVEIRGKAGTLDVFGLSVDEVSSAPKLPMR